MKKNGFTLIELLAVIIILGVIMLIAIPSVTRYINESRKKTYIDTARTIIKGATLLVNSGELDVYDTGTTYYIPSSCIAVEKGGKSPFGEFDPAYVVVTYDSNTFYYYWISRDTTGQGISEITLGNNLDSKLIEAGITKDQIDVKYSIGGRKNLMLMNDDCTSFEQKLISEDDIVNVSDGNLSNRVKTPNDILEIAIENDQVNIIQDTNIYIYKGGTLDPPANFIKFNDEDWRIIGIYGDQLKIVRVDSNGMPTTPPNFTTVKWNNTSPNPGWQNSSLNMLLNSTYYNTLSETAKNMIDVNGTWYTGSAQNNQTAYFAFKNSKISSSRHPSPWTGKVGMPASYEFLYASNGDNCQNVQGTSYPSPSFKEYCGLIEYDWLINPTSSYWTINGRTSWSSHSLYVHKAGAVEGVDVKTNIPFVPAVYLKSSIKIISGTGIITDPYILSI